MTKWEYLAFARTGGSWSDDRLDGRHPQEKLSDLGRVGWELVSVCYDGSGYHFYLKRALNEKGKTPSARGKAAIE